MPIEALFLREAHRTPCDAYIRQITETGALLDRTVFYPLGGGQAGDSGWLTLADGTRLRIADARKAPPARGGWCWIDCPTGVLRTLFAGMARSYRLVMA
jgi:alanyl-tRNA synthetase/misacylated tRNA(Ala) deacylase